MPLHTSHRVLHIIKQQEQIFREKIYSELTFLRVFEIRLKTASTSNSSYSQNTLRKFGFGSSLCIALYETSL